MVAFPRIRKGSHHDAENHLWDGSSPQHPSRQLSCRSRPANRWGLCCDFCFVPNGVSRDFSDLAEGWGLGRFAGFAARAKSPPFAASRAPGPRGPGGQRASSSPCWPGRDCRRRVRSITRMTRRLRALPDLRIRPLHSAAKLKDAARPVRGRARSAFIGTGVHPSFL